MNIVIGGVALTPIILFLVKLGEKLGLFTVTAEPIVIAVLSVVGYILLEITGLFPSTLTGIVAILQFLAMIAAAFGSSLLTLVGLRAHAAQARLMSK